MVASSHPGKQRLAIYQADVRQRRNLLGAHLSRALRKRTGRRNLPLVNGDTVRVLRGSHKGKEGKIQEMDRKRQKIFVQGLLHKKNDGKEAFVPFAASNLEIIDLETKDVRRYPKKGASKEAVPTGSAKKEGPVPKKGAEEKTIAEEKKE